MTAATDFATPTDVSAGPEHAADASARVKGLTLDVIAHQLNWRGSALLKQTQLDAVCRTLAPVVAGAAERAAPELTATIVLTDDDAVQALNITYRGQDKPTNVLSFPDEVTPDYLGDVIIARGVLEREADAATLSLDAHLIHLAIHGVLHLAGFDHVEDASADRMEAVEIELLEQLGIANPYAGESGSDLAKIDREGELMAR